MLPIVTAISRLEGDPMETQASKSYTWTSFGFIVLPLVFQQAYSFYSPLSMDYQILLNLASVVAWVIVFLATTLRRDSERVFFVASIILLGVAFSVQEAFLVFTAQGLHSREILTVSCMLFSAGYALYCRLWISAYEKKEPVKALICISASSGLSTILACLPPLVLGFDLIGNIGSFSVRLTMLALSFWCLHIELRRPFEWVAEEEATSSTGEAWNAIKLVIIAVLAARFVQGLLFMDEAAYREYGAWALLIASPLVSGTVILLARRFGGYSGFVPAFYWLLSTCALVILLVAASVIDSAIGFLWVLLFAVYSQIDVAFLGILSSLRKALGSSFPKLVCVLFCAKDFVFACGRIMRMNIDVQTGTLVCVIVLLSTAIVEIVVYLLQSVKSAHDKDEAPSIPEALTASMARRYELTPRETEVLLALLQGRSYTNIGYKLFISKSTVKTHANHIYAKIGVRSRDELIELLSPNGSLR